MLMSEIQDKILPLLTSFDGTNKRLALQLCVGLKGNYGEKVKELLCSPFYYFVGTRYGLEPDYWQKKESLDLSASTPQQELLFYLEEEIGGLCNLKELDVRSHQICDLPEEVECLDKLVALDLGYNAFEYFPKEVANMPSLRDLRLDSNAIDAIPENITNLQNLKCLSLVGNNIGQVPVFLKELPNLEYLHLGDNPISRFYLNQARKLLPDCKIIF